MAVTAAGSAEQIAVASIFAYDIYRDYFNKKATGKQLVFVSRVMVCIYGVVSGALAVILLKLELSLGWVYLFMGVVIGSAVLPVAFSITWKNCSAAGAISGSVLGFIAALISWLVSAKMLFGEITLKTTGGCAGAGAGCPAQRAPRPAQLTRQQPHCFIAWVNACSPAVHHPAGEDFPMLTGNIVAICFSGLVCIVVSLFSPQNFDWTILKEIPTIEEQAEVSRSSHWQP